MCTAHQIFSDGGMKIQINNGLGNDIGVKQVSFTSDTGTINCNVSLITGALPNGKVVPAGISETFTMKSENKCSSTQLGSYKGARIKGALNLRYIDLQTQFEHNQPGQLLTDVEEGSLPTETPAAVVPPVPPTAPEVPEPTAPEEPVPGS